MVVLWWPRWRRKRALLCLCYLAQLLPQFKAGGGDLGGKMEADTKDTKEEEEAEVEEEEGEEEEQGEEEKEVVTEYDYIALYFPAEQMPSLAPA